MLTLFELCGARKDVRFSPYVWRVKMMLEHKGIDYDTESVTFTDKSALEGSGFSRVPAIRHNGEWMDESLEIARYLDRAFPEKPLFTSSVAAAQASIITAWIDQNVLMPTFMMIVADIFDALDGPSQVYFRETREPRIGCTIESTREGRDDRRKAFQATLSPIETILMSNDFLSGEAPAFADYCLMGCVMFAHIVSDFDPYEGNAPLTAWRARMFDLFDGFARKAPRSI